MAPFSIYLGLGIAIIAEVIATTALTKSDGFTRLWPSLIAVVGYGLAIWLLSIALRAIPTGIVYAIWSGVGIVLIAIVSWIWFKQALDLPAILGLTLIVSGVLVVNLFSKTLTL